VATQQPANVQEQVHTYRVAHEKEIIGEFVRLLSLPNRASDTRDIERNAAFIQKMLENRGVRVRMLGVPGAPPVGSTGHRSDDRDCDRRSHYPGGDARGQCPDVLV
jgi:hypothetical protein